MRRDRDHDPWPWLPAAPEDALPANPAAQEFLRGEASKHDLNDYFDRFLMGDEHLPVRRIQQRLADAGQAGDLYPVGRVQGEMDFIFLMSAKGHVFAMNRQGVAFAGLKMGNALHDLRCQGAALSGERNMVEEDLFVPYASAGILALEQSKCVVLSESYDEAGIAARVRGFRYNVDALLAKAR